MKDNIAIKVIH